MLTDMFAGLTQKAVVTLRYVKQEVVDPDYTNRSSPPENLIEKVKRSYTRSPKPSNGPKAPRAKKIKKEPTANGEDTPTGKQTQIEDHMPVQKRKRDRFKGMTEEEVLKRVLPDHIKEGLDILIVSDIRLTQLNLKFLTYCNHNCTATIIACLYIF